MREIVFYLYSVFMLMIPLRLFYFHFFRIFFGWCVKQETKAIRRQPKTVWNQNKQNSWKLTLCNWLPFGGLMLLLMNRLVNLILLFMKHFSFSSYDFISFHIRWWIWEKLSFSIALNVEKWVNQSVQLKRNLFFSAKRRTKKLVARITVYNKINFVSVF